MPNVLGPYTFGFDEKNLPVRRLLDIFAGAAFFESCISRPMQASYGMIGGSRKRRQPLPFLIHCPSKAAIGCRVMCRSTKLCAAIRGWAEMSWILGEPAAKLFARRRLQAKLWVGPPVILFDEFGGGRGQR